MQNFAKTVPFDGETERALDTAETILLPQGFRVVHRTNQDIDLEGPSVPIHRGSLYWGAGRVRLSRHSNGLRLEVAMEHIQRSDWIGWKIVAGFAVIVAAMMAYSMPRMSAADASWLPLFMMGCFLTAVLIISLIVRQQRKQTIEAYERLLDNAAALASAG